MKNILILEDDPSRMLAFERKLEGHNMVHARAAEEAIALLEEYEWDIVFLDHDLGGEIMVDHYVNRNTGYTVAKWLEENPDQKPATVIIHSFNPDGANSMAKAIPGAIRIPGAWKYTLEQIDEGVGSDIKIIGNEEETGQEEGIEEETGQEENREEG
jgi:CheY-like chemotaxis protein